MREATTDTKSRFGQAMEILYDEQTLSVTVTDAFENTGPSNLVANALTVAENEAIGTVVGQVNATDPDAGATLTYSLISGVGDTHNNLFTLESNGTLKTAVTFDYESNASTYAVRVEARDEYNATVEGNFTVALTNANEPPVLPQSFSFTLSENNGSSVFLVSASDPDSGSNLIYSLSGPDAGQFMINASTGELSFIQPPDYEAMGSSAGDNLYEFSVSVSDGQSQSNSQIYVEVTDGRNTAQWLALRSECIRLSPDHRKPAGGFGGCCSLPKTLIRIR